jgi:hypothetical protein
MFRSSVAAFYPSPRCLSYRLGCFPCGGFIIVFLRPPGSSEVKKVVHWMSEILFAAEIAFRCLDGYMPQQELNLLQLATVGVTQLRAGPPQVMRRNMLQAHSLAATLDYVPHDILRDAFPPYLSRPGDGSKDPSLRNPGCSSQLIECCFRPFWNGHRADVATLADQVHHCPVPLTHLDFVQLQPDQLGSAKATPKKQASIA